MVTRTLHGDGRNTPNLGTLGRRHTRLLPAYCYRAPKTPVTSPSYRDVTAGRTSPPAALVRRRAALVRRAVRRAGPSGGGEGGREGEREREGGF